ncbi:MAG: hypothetical protein H6810_06150 [Phycisphaeraceae bacterium]|nr:MAG: hypothetical protein H6810_06150 [Phycisphaeraceae bacterium]
MIRGRAVCCATLALCAGLAVAAPKDWDGGAGNLLWFADLNWDPDGVPGPADQANVDIGTPVVADGLPLSVERLHVTSGLALVSSSLHVTGDSSITGLATSGCCSTNITADAGLAIDGTSTFLKRPIFKGAGATTIAGTAVMTDGMTVDNNAHVVIAGHDVLSNTGQINDGGECRITGTLSLDTGSLLTFGAGQWLVDGGVAEKVGPGAATVQGNLVLQSGTVRADEGTWDLLNHDLRGGTLEVTNAGTLLVRATGVPTYDATAYQGRGTINLYGSATIGSTGNPITANVSGGGLVLRNTLTLGADITNTATLLLSNTTLNGSGRIESTGAVTLSGANVNSDILASGGTVLVTGTSTAAAHIDIQSGATISFLASLNAPGSLAPGRLHIAGAMTHNNFTGGGDVDVGIPVDLDAGGVIRANGGQLRLRGGGVWSGGDIEIEEVTLGFSPTLAMLGDSSDQYLVGGDVSVSDEGSDNAQLQIGAAFGLQPAVQVDGTLTLAVGWSKSLVSCYVPAITGSGQIVNGGNFDILRTIDVTPTIINANSMSLGASVTLTAMTNAASASVSQQNDAVFRSDAVVHNAGEWHVAISSGLKKILPSTTGAKFDNTGAYRVEGPVFASVEVRFENSGLVLADQGTAHFADAVNVTGGGAEPFIVGNWIAVNGGKIEFENPPTTVGSSLPEAPPTSVSGSGASTPWVNGVSHWNHATANLGTTACDDPAVAFDHCDVNIAPSATLTTHDINAADTSINLAPGSTCTANAIDMGGCAVDANNATIQADSVHADAGTTYDLRGASTLQAEGFIDLTGQSSLSIEQGSSAGADAGTSVGGFNSVIDDIDGVVVPSLRGPTAPPLLTTPLLDLHARFTPAVGGIGSFTVDGDLLMHDTARLIVETLGPGATDRADITGQATLAGVVQLDTPDGYIPALADSLLVMTAANGFAGAIDHVEPRYSGAARWRAQTVGTELRLVAACAADLAEPFNLLDLQDVLAFVSAFTTNDPDADLDNNGLFDLVDLTGFVSAFLGGCD